MENNAAEYERLKQRELAPNKSAQDDSLFGKEQFGYFDFRQSQ